MLKSVTFILLACAVLISAAVALDNDPGRPTPIMRTVTPDEAKSGDTLSITGEYLQKTNVADVYLTNGTENFKLQILSQSEGKIEARIREVKAGRLRLMVLTAGLEPRFVEQPVVVQIQ